jgi:hypothetical protein
MNKIIKLHLRTLGSSFAFLAISWAASVFAAPPAATATSSSTSNDTPSSPAAGSESLGEKLLDDLNPSLFSPPAASPKSNSPPTSVPQARPTFNKRIVPDLSDPVDGEDLGQPSGSAALARIEEQMQAAQSLLHQAKSPDRAGQAQQQVVADLDALIEQLSKQCQGGACQSSGPSKPSSQRSQTAGAKPAAKPGHGSAPARDSTTRIGRNDPGAVDLGDREQLVKDFWGQLPPHAREQLLQSNSEEFLPQYELEIEQYYRRLSAEPSDAGPSSR